MIDRETLESRAVWHALSFEALLDQLQSDGTFGLSGAEALRRQATVGPNELPAEPPVSPWRLLLSQFSSLIIWVLIGAAILSGLLQEWIDAVAILAIVLLNGVLGFVQEYKAERALAALKRLSIATARVVREGVLHSIPARDLVPGDVIEVEAGDHVPVDARLLSAATLRVQESALTGESMPVDKNARFLGASSLPLADRRNMLFFGTSLVGGKGRALVVATGLRTELGRIAALMQTKGDERTSLERKMEHLGRRLLSLSLIAGATVFGAGLVQGEPWLIMLLTAVSLAVAAIPEGLPAIVTMTLALGVVRMVKQHALIRRLAAIEALGTATVICTDKTGTLTKNEMTVTALYLGASRMNVTGEGYAPHGEIRVGGLPAHRSQALVDLLSAAVLCNNAELSQEDGRWRIVGDPTEAALLVVAAKHGVWKKAVATQQPLLREIPFNPGRKLMTMVRRTPDGAIAYVKGAPEVVLARASSYLTENRAVVPLETAERERFLAVGAAFARESLRVIAVARRVLTAVPDTDAGNDVERELTLLGLVAMKDPLRPEAVEAVRACRGAGIRTIMITGDHKETGIAIARELGILNGYDAIAGLELDRLSDAELAERVERIAVYARVSAADKLRVVKAWKARGAVVAMTGDGVNDAPAVKEADIGVAMGLAGTDVTKEASDMVVTDDNFASIAKAVETGRGIYSNILKTIQYLVSGNIGEVLVMLLAAVLGLPLPLLPVQILWINLVTDSLPALALAIDPVSPGIMHEAPRRAADKILNGERLGLMLVQGLFLAVLVLGVFTVALWGRGETLGYARTLAFSVLMMAHLVHALNCRSNTVSIFVLGLHTNLPLLAAIMGSAVLQVLVVWTPWMQPIFNVVSLSPADWFLVVGLALSPLGAMELWKAIRALMIEPQHGNDKGEPRADIAQQ